MQFRIFLNLILMLLASLSVLAQESRSPGATMSGQITGQVRYVEGNRPAVNILVSCDGSTQGNCGQVMTDQSGRFSFTGLAPTQFVITVRAPGYIEQRQNVELLTSPSAYLQFQLRSNGSANPGSGTGATTNSAVPPAAQKEFDLATAALATGTKEGVAEAVRHLEKAVTIYPKFTEAELKAGTAYMDLQQWDKAEAALRKALEIDAHAANAFFALGEVYRRQKKYDQAEKVLLDGMAEESRSAQAHLTLARVYWEKVAGVKDEAVWRPSMEKSYQEVNQALQFDPNLAAAHLLKGNLLFKVRRAEDALREYDEYLRLDPKGEFADQTRALADKIRKALAETKKP